MKGFFFFILTLLILSSCADTSSVKSGDRFIDVISEQLVKKNPTVPFVTVEQVLKEHRGTPIVDMRADAEYKVSKLPGALPFSEEMIHGLANKEFIIYCTQGMRSFAMAKELLVKGYRVKVLRGGILKWIFKGGTLKDQDDLETKKVHVYTESWNIVPKGYKGVYEL